MPYKAGLEESQDLVKELNGTISHTIGQDNYTVWVVTFKDTKQFAKAETELRKNKQIHAVQRDFLLSTEEFFSNDPFYPQQWHLPAMNVPPTWSLGLNRTFETGFPCLIDSGVDFGADGTLQNDLAVPYGYDAVNKQFLNGVADLTGHGTLVASSVFSFTNNNTRLAGFYDSSPITPIAVRVVDRRGRITTSAVIEAFNSGVVPGHGVTNLSLNAPPPYSLANPSAFPALHEYFRRYHDMQDGIIVCAAGNDGKFDSNARLPYLMVVSAINNDYELAPFSNYGHPIWFTAPGTNILCFDKKGKVKSVSGTSFACAMVAAVAHITKSIDINITNTQVEQVMMRNATNLKTGSWNPFYGYGMPDLYACVREMQRQVLIGDPPPLPPGARKLYNRKGKGNTKNLEKFGTISR